MSVSITAKRGAAFLDEKVPGWADMINLETLNLGSTCVCVLAQVEAGLHPRTRKSPWLRFMRGLQELGISDKDAHHFGFHGQDDGIVGRTWRKLIKERQTA